MRCVALAAASAIGARKPAASLYLPAPPHGSAQLRRPQEIVNASHCAASVCGIALALVACARDASSQPPAAAVPASAAASAAATGCLPSHDGYLRARLRGAQNLDIDWQDRELQCDGGPRPGQRGVRLTFAGPALPGGQHLRFVFGIAGALQAGSARDLPVNVTVIFEGESKIYSTRGEDKCTVDELSETPVQSAPAAQRLRIAARGFCVAPAAAADGSAGILLSRFDFAGSVLYEDDAPDAAAYRT